MVRTYITLFSQGYAVATSHPANRAFPVSRVSLMVNCLALILIYSSTGTKVLNVILKLKPCPDYTILIPHPSTSGIFIHASTLRAAVD